ncbi:MAG: glycosyltransferase family 9 protein [Armatimonadota bacterium]
MRLSSIGDVVMGTPTAAALKKARPDLHVAWVVEDRSHELLLGNPWIDEVLVAPRSRWSQMRQEHRYVGILQEVWAFLQKVRQRGFDIAVDLQGRLKSALTAFASGAPVRVGPVDAGEGSRAFYTCEGPVGKKPGRASERYLRILGALGVQYQPMDMHVAVQPQDMSAAEAVLARLGVLRPYAVLCPATTFRTKFWTAGGFAAVADELYKEFGLRSVVVGAQVDAPLALEIASLANVPVAVAAGHTSLRTAAAVIARASLVVSVDTGLLFVALAVGTPAVGLFGPTIHSHLAGERVVVVSKPFPCAPCRRNPTCANRDCMTAITPKDVVTAAGSALERFGALRKPACI